MIVHHTTACFVCAGRCLCVSAEHQRAQSAARLAHAKSRKAARKAVNSSGGARRQNRFQEKRVRPHTKSKRRRSYREEARKEIDDTRESVALPTASVPAVIPAGMRGDLVQCTCVILVDCCCIINNRYCIVLQCASQRRRRLRVRHLLASFS